MLDQRKRAMLSAMEIPLFCERQAGVPETNPSAPARVAEPAAVAVVEAAQPKVEVAPRAAQANHEAAPPTAPAEIVDTSSMGWDELTRTVAECRACPLHEKRTQAVLGVGDRSAKLMIIGEAPGQQEDIRGEPFVGRAGMLLDNILRAIGFPRESVYIANVVKCRPPNNRDPQEAETATCRRFLDRQVALIQPQVILVVGRIAAQSLLQSTTPVGKLRGQRYRYPDSQIPLFVTYHPAYLLRRPGEKAKVWQDLKFVLEQWRGSAG